MKAKNKITAEYASARLAYNPETGQLIYNRVPEVDGVSKGFNTVWSGKVAGCISRHGYWTLYLDHVRYFNHRLIWLIQTGVNPEVCIDHINGIKSDNRWVNLREATVSQNGMNRLERADNASGKTGIWFDANRGNWMAYIGAAGRRTYLGRFPDFNDAVTARTNAEAACFGRFSPNARAQP